MTKIAIVLTENYTDWESAMLAAVLRGFYGVNVVTASPDGKPVTSSGGFAVTPAAALAALSADEIDMLIVNGGTQWDLPAGADLVALMRGMRARGKPVAAICGAVKALAQTGLIDGVPHTGNSAEELASVEGYRGGARFVAQPPALSYDGIITAAGTAPVSFMKAVCEALGFGGPQLDFYVGVLGAEHRAA
ncbi:MAG: DJ-1/PfpI family protein [Alphaproteobacteria bacterium]|nr:DJ-1/PfpI family protein [Alphaproteobacteria bacterium]